MKNFIYKFLEIQFFIIWILAVVIPKNLFIPIFVMEIFIFFLVVLFNIFKIKDNLYTTRQGKKIWKLFFAFFVWAGIMLFFSYRNIVEYWNLLLLLYDESYVFRHFMVVAELFLSIGLGYTLMKTGNLYKIKNIYLFFFSVLLAVVMIYNSKYVIFLGGLFVAIVSLLSFKTNNKLLLFFVPFVMISHSAYVLASAAMLMLVFLKNPFKSFFSSLPVERIIFLLLIIVVVIIIMRDDINIMIHSDNNALWRLQVWTNELQTLAQTNFMGVGFGTTYVTYDIYNIVINANMYLDADGGIYERLFLVANHNSVLNMFYRMGIVGGVLFLSWNIIMLGACLNSFRNNVLGEHNNYCWWAFANYIYNFLIILMNPGMEMMQFAINYTFSLGLMFAIIFSTNKEISKGYLVPK